MSVIEIDSENYNREVLESNIPVLLDVYTDWCGPCKMVAPFLEAFSEEFLDKIKICKVDGEKCADIAGKYSVSVVPCLIFSKDGKELDRMEGMVSKDELQERIEKFIADN